MKCSEIEDKLTAYLENFLQNEERNTIEEHCAQCSHCQRSLKDLKQTRNILEKLDELEPPSWLTEKVMAGIYETEEKKGWFQRIFLPLRVKIPIQALAMGLVVVLSVYLYRSTAPEPGNLDRSQYAPPVSRAVDPSAKPRDDQKEKKDAGPYPRPKQSEGKTERQIRKVPKPEAPGLEWGRSGNKPDSSHMPSVAAEKDAFSDQALKNDKPVGKAAVPPQPKKMERYKTRGMAAREETRAEYQKGASETSRETPSQIIVTAGDPSDIVRKARRILISLSAKEVKERTENNCVVISGLIDPKQVSELENRMAEIARVHEIRAMTGDAPQLVEIIILKDPGGSH